MLFLILNRSSGPEDFEKVGCLLWKKGMQWFGMGAYVKHDLDPGQCATVATVEDSDGVYTKQEDHVEGREECEQGKENYDVNIEPVGFLEDRDCEEEYQEDYEECDEDCFQNHDCEEEYQEEHEDYEESEKDFLQDHDCEEEYLEEYEECDEEYGENDNESEYDHKAFA